jgi:hypothetical protein
MKESSTYSYGYGEPRPMKQKGSEKAQQLLLLHNYDYMGGMKAMEMED